MKEKTFSSEQLSSIIIILSNMNDKLRAICNILSNEKNDKCELCENYTFKKVMDFKKGE